MSRTLSGPARRELVRALRRRYAAGSRPIKTRIFEEFVSVSGNHRKSAIRILNGTVRLEGDSKGRSRPRLYDEATWQALIVLWEDSDGTCGKRLRARLPVLVPALERNGHLALDPAIRAQVLTLSPATIDRLLHDVRSGAGRDG